MAKSDFISVQRVKDRLDDAIENGTVKWGPKVHAFLEAIDSGDPSRRIEKEDVAEALNEAGLTSKKLHQAILGQTREKAAVARDEDSSEEQEPERLPFRERHPTLSSRKFLVPAAALLVTVAGLGLWGGSKYSERGMTRTLNTQLSDDPHDYANREVFDKVMQTLDRTGGNHYEAAYELLSHLEGSESTVYPDGKGNATIGMGFNFDRDDPSRVRRDWESAFSSAGIACPDFDACKEGVESLNEAEIKALLISELKRFEGQIRRQLSRYGGSDIYDSLTPNEKTSLLSMAYNGGAGLVGPNMTRVLRQDEAQAIFGEITENNNASTSLPIENRRLLEGAIALGNAEALKSEERTDRMLQAILNRGPTNPLAQIVEALGLDTLTVRIKGEWPEGTDIHDIIPEGFRGDATIKNEEGQGFVIKNGNVTEITGDQSFVERVRANTQAEQQRGGP